MHNDSSIKAAELRLRQAALSKLINSLSWKAAIVRPSPVDAERTVWVVDIRKLDWDRHDLWRKVLALYPYGLKHNRYPDDAKVREAAKKIHEMAGTTLPAVRADWFIATASRPPLYHDLLRLPDTAGELEALLKVDVRDNFRRNQLARAGFTSSGVSVHNRMVERHEAAHGAYWLSFDSNSSDGESSFVRFPLGPRFKGNPFADKAFVHAGGEIIFHLPNGLQGYLLVDDKGKRIDRGPIAVVRDKTETAGSVEVVNGLSCMSCHKHGMIKDFSDIVRANTRLGGESLDKVRELYVTDKEMKKLLDADEAQFLRGLERATGQFLEVGKGPDSAITDFPEVIGPIARSYLLREVDAATAARELEIKDKATLEAAIKANDRLRRLGLLPLAQGNTIKREVWESRAGLISPFQETALALKLGSSSLEK